MYKLKNFIKNTPLRTLACARTLFRTFKYYNKYARIAGGKDSLRDIEVVSIEFCSVCNLKCRYCFLDKGTRAPFLDINIYDKLLFEICENREYGIRIMEWPISGCFFLHPEHKKIIEMTRRYKEKYPGFRPWVILNDNMMLFDKDNIDFVLRQGVVNKVICSIDGVDKKTFEYMRPQADYDKVLENTNFLLNNGKKIDKHLVVQINNGRSRENLFKRPEPRLKEIFDKSDGVIRWEPVDWNESFHTPSEHYFPAKHFCSFVFESVVLSTSGSILKCCMDLKEKTAYGDFSKNSLKSIWFSQERKDFLKKMREGKRDLIPGCNNCSITYVSQNN